MTIEERRNYLLLLCDCEEYYRAKQTYRSYLESAASKKFVPAETWEEICDRLEQDPGIGELVAARFVPHYSYATQGLSDDSAQKLLEDVRSLREKQKHPVQ